MSRLDDKLRRVGAELRAAMHAEGIEDLGRMAAYSRAAFRRQSERGRKLPAQDRVHKAYDDPRIYACEHCGRLMNRAEGGNVFTLCDDCRDRVHQP